MACVDDLTETVCPGIGVGIDATILYIYIATSACSQECPEQPNKPHHLSAYETPSGDFVQEHAQHC